MSARATEDAFWLNWWRVGGACGIIALILFIVGAVVSGDTPVYDDSLSEIRQWHADNGQQLLVSDYIIFISIVVFLVPFLNALRGILSWAEGGEGVWSWVAFTGGILFIIFAGVSAFFISTIAFSLGVAEQDLSDDTIRALYYLDHHGFAAATGMLAPLFLGSSLVIWRTKVLWRWLAIIGFIGFVIAVLGPLYMLEDEAEGPLGIFNFLSFIAVAIWVLLLSIAMLMKPVLTAEPGMARHPGSSP